jgi:hypothetical protein
MKKNQKNIKLELNDDIQWDCNFYQGRSRLKVETNEKISFYSTAGLLIIVVISIISSLF